MGKCMPGLVRLKFDNGSVQRLEWVSVIRDSVKMSGRNNSMINMKVIRGRLKKLLFSKTGKFAEDVTIERCQCQTIPNHLSNHIDNPRESMLLLGCADLFREETDQEEIKQLTHDREAALRERNTYKATLDRITTQLREMNTPQASALLAEIKIDKDHKEKS